jgi:hypothetical protein
VWVVGPILGLEAFRSIGARKLILQQDPSRTWPPVALNSCAWFHGSNTGDERIDNPHRVLIALPIAGLESAVKIDAFEASSSPSGS